MACRWFPRWLRSKRWYGAKIFGRLIPKIPFYSHLPTKFFLNSSSFTLFWIGAKSNPFSKNIFSVYWPIFNSEDRQEYVTVHHPGMTTHHQEIDHLILADLMNFYKLKSHNTKQVKMFHISESNCLLKGLL